MRNLLHNWPLVLVSLLFVVSVALAGAEAEQSVSDRHQFAGLQSPGAADSNGVN